MAERPLFAGVVNDLFFPPFGAATLDLDDYFALADDPDALLDRLDLVMTYGTMSTDTRTAIRDAISLIQNLEIRTRVALYLVFISPDYAVEL
jgi:hypothetical protein